ncbi:spore coat protein CotJB [Clostridium sporogenes]|uniref:spore coat protein CotJB n=1 Tax=unclassified Clostridium TaxID=2614128 RepID=UPI0013D0EA02|nr:spore coat protein CotJB [Clostridium sporogenes]NFS26394.1 spore coat protein CotJB [Clostridium sporogenes]
MLDKYSRKELLFMIQQYEFTAVELNLYLDNYPENKKALEYFNEISCKLEELIETYEKRFGPLFNFGFSRSDSPWKWVTEPWPWEKEYSRM